MPSQRTLGPGGKFTPRKVRGLALWLDASNTSSLWTTDAGAVTPIADPTSISGCVLWLDGADSSSTGMVLNGSFVAVWRDKSGNSNNASANGTTRPVLTPNGLNGKSVVTFDGVDDALQITANAAFNTNALTYFVVFKQDSAANKGVYTKSNGSNNTNGFALAVRSDTSVWLLQKNNGESQVIASTINPTTQARIYSVISSSSATGYLDGQSPVTASSVADHSLSQRVMVGSRDSAESLNGYIAEVIHYNRALTRSEVAQVEVWLAAKWGISGVHTPATATSDPVGAWLDKSGNARHATQSTAGSRPLVSTAAINSRSALLLDGSNDLLNLGNLASAFPTAATLFVVCAPHVGAGATTSWSAFSNGGNSWEQYPPGVSYASVFRAQRVNAVPTALPYNGAAYQGSSIIIRYRSSSSGWGQFVNGGVSHITAANYSAAVNNSAIGYTIGADTSGGGVNGPFKGRICEVLAYSENLSDSQCATIERWLSRKWSAVLVQKVSNLDAQDWINRVHLNGGTVSASTAAAVNTFCNAIEQAGIRDKFYRLNLFAGSFQGAFVPLFRGIATGSGGNILTKYTNNDGGLFSSALWQVLSASTTTKGSQVAAPDGTLSATSVTLAGTTGTSAGLRMISNGDWVANATGTFSVWARQPASGGAAAIRLGTNNTAGWSTGVAQKFTLTTEWQRFAVSGAISNTSNLYALIGTPNAASAGAHDPDCNGIVELWRPQIEVGTTATAWQACQYGNATDTNSGSPAFLATDYAETGASGGLLGNGSSKRLETGFSLASLPSAASRHISVYEIAKSPNQSDVSIGGTHSSSVDGMVLGTRDSATTYAWSRGGPNDAVVSASAYNGSAFWIGQNTTLRASQLYKNGIIDNAATLTSDVTSTAANTIDLFAWRITGGAPDPAFVAYSSARLGGYSIGLSMNTQEVAVYNEAMQAFQKALYRDRATSDPAFSSVTNTDARLWTDAVYANSGSVTVAVANAVNTFCNAIDAAGIRSRFYRLNLFCGNTDGSLAAVRTPLYRGQSPSGPQYGGGMDTAVNFASTDYSLTTGLTGNSSSGKYLNTGVPANTIPSNNVHLGAGLLTSTPWSVAGSYLVGLATPGDSTHLADKNISGLGVAQFGKTASDCAGPTGTLSAGRYVATYPNLLRFGARQNPSATTFQSPTTTATHFVFAANSGSSPTGITGSRLGWYSIGNAFGNYDPSGNSQEVGAFDLALSQFLSAIGRS